MVEIPEDVRVRLEKLKDTSKIELAAKELAQMGDKAKSYVLNALKDETTRIGAARVLNMMASEGTAKFSNEDRRRIKGFLEKEKDPGTIINLCGTIMYSSEGWIKNQKLSTATAKYVLPFLMNVSKSKKASYEDSKVAISVIGGIMRETPVPELNIKAVDCVKSFHKEYKFHMIHKGTVRWLTAEALGCIGDPVALPTLEELGKYGSKQFQGFVKERIRGIERKQKLVKMHRKPIAR